MENYLTGCPENPRPFFPQPATVDGVPGTIIQTDADRLTHAKLWMKLGIRKKGKRVTSAGGLRGLIRIKGHKMWHQEVCWMPVLANGWRRLSLREHQLHYGFRKADSHEQG